MGVATLSETGGLKGLIFAVWIDPKLPDPPQTGSERPEAPRGHSRRPSRLSSRSHGPRPPGGFRYGRSAADFHRICSTGI